MRSYVTVLVEDACPMDAEAIVADALAAWTPSARVLCARDADATDLSVTTAAADLRRLQGDFEAAAARVTAALKRR